MEDSTPNQAEHEQISSALEVEKLEVHLFRSKSLWMPARARGVFGGSVNTPLPFRQMLTGLQARQVISQALVSATNCVDPTFSLHVRLRLHALASGSRCSDSVPFS